MWYFIYEFLESYFSENSSYSVRCMTVYFVYIFPICVSMNLVSIILLPLEIWQITTANEVNSSKESQNISIYICFSAQNPWVIAENCYIPILWNLKTSFVKTFLKWSRCLRGIWHIFTVFEHKIIVTSQNLETLKTKTQFSSFFFFFFSYESGNGDAKTNYS